jgi:hypothetical protein
MSGVECPKCGRATRAGAIICPGCDYILDASFLGDDITDDERDDRRRARGARSSAPTPQRIDFGEDAMILGKVDEADVSSFHSHDAGVSQREVTQTRFYVGGTVAQLMEPHAIPELAGGVGGASIRMTPFERHVMSLINGRRSIGRILKKSGIEETEFKTAVAMLADKGFIRLKGWKKPRPVGHSTIGGSSRTGSMVRAAPQPEPERTVVVHVEPAKSNVVSRRSAKPVRPAAPQSISGLPSTSSRAPSTSTPPRSPPEQARPAPAVPPPPRSSRAVAQGAKDLEKSADVPTAERAKVVVPSGRFASLRAEVPSASEGSNAERRARSEVAEAADRWELDDNRSSVFAEGPGTAVGSADGALDSAAQRAEILAVLNDATGIGDALAPSDEVGLPAPDNADDEEDEPPFASAEALSSDVIEVENGKATGRAISKDDFDVHVVSDASRLSDRATLPPGQRPVEVSARARSDGHDADEGASTHSQGLKALRPMTLPPSALAPVEPAPSPPTSRVAPPSAPTVTTTPQPASAQPTGVPASPNKPTVTTAPATAAQAPLPAPPAPTKPTTPQAAHPTAGLGKPPLPRVSASSQVSFELRKKAERIYEQALKDHAEGRISSALMNARLAMNFDPTVETYRTLHEELSRHKVAPSKAGAAGARPQELVLFEQASEAEGRGEHAKAVALLGQAIAINPRAAALHNRLGVLLSIRLKRHEEALVHLKKAVELEPGSVVYMNNFSKVTGLLESLIQKAPRKKGGAPQDDRVAVKKIRPKIF